MKRFVSTAFFALIPLVVAVWLFYRPIPSIYDPYHIQVPIRALCPGCGTATTLSNMSGITTGSMQRYRYSCGDGWASGIAGTLVGTVAECDDTVNYAGDEICWHGRWYEPKRKETKQ